MVVLKVSVEPFKDNLGPENLIPAPLFLFWGKPDMQLDCVEGGKHPPGILRTIQVTRVGFDACSRVTGNTPVILTERVMTE